MAWETTDRYFSGQGVVLLAPRSATGKPMGFYPVGNVPDLKISLAVTNLEHKESKTGQRSIDKRLQLETKCNLSMTLENFDRRNLASAMRGSYATVEAGSATDEPVEVYSGAISSLPHIKVSGATVTVNSVAMTAYTDDDTPWDYRMNNEAGSIIWNDGAVLAQDKLGVVVTGITVGTTTVITATHNLAVGDMVSFSGFTGADAADINGKTATVTAVTGTTAFTVDLDTDGGTITTDAASMAVWDGMEALVSYSYEKQTQVEALTEGSNELYMRFEGLNTAESNEPVVVEVFKFSTDPLKELSMISDGIQQFVLEGSVLADASRVTGSKFYSVKQLED